MGPAVAIVAAVASIASTGFSIYSASRANQSQESAQKAQQKQQNLAAQRERVRAIRQARIQRAEAFNAAEQVGAANSSAIGGIDALKSELGSNLGYSNQQQGLSNFAFDRLQKAADFNAQANLFGQIAGLGQTVYNAAGGIPFSQTTTSDIFKTKVG